MKQFKVRLRSFLRHNRGCWGLWLALPYTLLMFFTPFSIESLLLLSLALISLLVWLLQRSNKAWHRFSDIQEKRHRKVVRQMSEEHARRIRMVVLHYCRQHCDKDFVHCEEAKECMELCDLFIETKNRFANGFDKEYQRS